MDLGILVRPISEECAAPKSYGNESSEYNDSLIAAIYKRATNADEFRLLPERTPHNIEAIVDKLKKQCEPQLCFVHGVVFINEEGDDFVFAEKPGTESTECRAAGLWYPTLGIIEEANTADFYLGNRTWEEGKVRVTDAIDSAHDAWMRLLAFVAYPIVALRGRIREPPLSMQAAERAIRIADKFHILYQDTHDYGYDLAKAMIRSGMAGK